MQNEMIKKHAYELYNDYQFKGPTVFKIFTVVLVDQFGMKSSDLGAVKVE